MNDRQLFDQAVTSPDADLLGMEAYAEKLAKYIERFELPFTIGVYGEWGDGKTSFVNLLRHYLENQRSANDPPLKFVCFSAWPYTTSDELWRALIITIADDLYPNEKKKVQEEKRQEEKRKAQSKATSFRRQLAEFLRNDALILSKSRSEDDVSLVKYKQLLEKLDRTAYGSISKSTDQHWRINQEMALFSVVKGAIAVLGTVSPLGGVLQGLLGSDSGASLTDVLYKEKNEATRESIESTEEFKEVFRDLIRNRPGGRMDDPVYIFIDDLDRCMPDAALDILEGIKNFMDDVPCIFIVAADEQLIGQGLRLRYRDLYANFDNERVRSFMAQKGREYFEKITQLGIRVPPRTTEQLRAFISAQYPEWIAAADIIQAAVGTNPRRLKQHANLLSYQYEVIASLTENNNGDATKNGANENDRFQLCDKMIALYYLFSREQAGLEVMGRLAETPHDYLQTMRQLEQNLLKQAEKAGPQKPEEADEENDDDYTTLFDMALGSPALLKIFRQWGPKFQPGEGVDHSQPPLSEDDLQPYLRLMDITPTPEPSDAMFQTQDKRFMRVLEAVKQERTISGSELLERSQEKFDGLQAREPGKRLYRLLTDLARSLAAWAAEAPVIDEWLDSHGHRSTIEAEASDEVSEIIKLLHDHEEKLVQQEKALSAKRAEAEAMEPGGPPAAPDASEEALPDPDAEPDQPEPASTAKKAQTGNPDSNNQPAAEVAPNQALAAEIDQLQQEVDELRELSERLLEPPRLREISGEELLSLEDEQIKAKMTARLDDQIELARHFLWLRVFAKLYALDSKWDRLGRLLQDNLTIPENFEERALQRASQIPLEPLPEGSPIRSLWDEYGHDQHLLDLLQLPPLFSDIWPDERDQYFAVSRVVITPPAVEEEATPQAELKARSKIRAEAQVVSPSQPNYESLFINITSLDPADKAGDLRRYRIDYFSAADGQSQPYEIEVKAPEFDRVMKLIQSSRRPSNQSRIGSEICNLFFSAEAQAFLDKELTRAENIRLVFQLDSPELKQLPWESLHLLSQKSNLALSSNYSLVRYLPSQKLVPPRPQPPLRVLAVLSSPAGFPQLHLSREIDSIQQALKRDSRRIELETLSQTEATVLNLHGLIRSFKPHLFHYTGHWQVTSDGLASSLMLEDGWWSYSEFEHRLESDAPELQLLVLNAGSSARTLTQAAQSRAVATIASFQTESDPDTQLRFSRSFYRALGDGLTIEDAVTRTRLDLNKKGLDWSAYALFTGAPDQLDNLVLVPKGTMTVEQRIDTVQEGGTVTGAVLGRM